MTLGQRILQIRTAHGLSQEAFGERLGTTRQTVSRWELDQTYPEISKIVLISKLFAVTTDFILKDGVSTFDVDMEYVSCGVYRDTTCEIVETEAFVLMLYSSCDKTVLGAKLYKGFENKQRLVAICERNVLQRTTEYAYVVESGSPRTVISNSETLAKALDEAYDVQQKRTMRRLETFAVDHSGSPLPTVREAGIPKALTLWRMNDSYRATHTEMHFFLCTGKTEYVFSIDTEDTNIYCGASYNVVFDLGLFGGGQFFRIRTYKDNREAWCGCFCDFSFEVKDTHIPTGQCALGKCLQTDYGYMWCVKRYTDDEIVLQGCGDDEYTYRRTDRRTEQFSLEKVRTV